MSAPGNKIIVTQLVVDASGAKTGVDEYEAALSRARDAADAAGTSNGSFDSTVKKWTQSLGATDPVLRAQVQQQQALQRQMELNNRVVQLGVATQDAANVQLDKVRQKYQGYIDDAKGAAESQTTMGHASEYLVGAMEPLVALFAAGSIVEFAKASFERAAALNDEAEQVGASVETYQSYLAVMKQTGIANDNAAQLLGKLTLQIGQARNEAGPARDAFNQLGVTYQDLAAGIEGALPRIAESLLAIPDASERARLETDLFGRSGQKLESSLRVLIDPASDLTAKMSAMGLVLGHDVTTAANDADTKLGVAWDHLKVEGTPTIVAFTEALASMVGWLGKIDPTGLNAAANIANGNQDMFAKLSAIQLLANGAAFISGPAGFMNMPNLSKASGTAGKIDYQPPAVNDNTAYSGIGGGADAGYSTRELDQYIAKQKLSADIAGEAPIQQAQTNQLIEAANIKLASGAGLSADQLAHFQNSDGTMRKFVTSTSEAVDVLGQATAQEVKGYAATIARGNEWNKLKTTFGGYLDSLSEESRIAGETTAQRETEQAVIKGAQVFQKENNAQAKDLVQTYDQALGKLNAQQVAEIEIREAAKVTAATDKEITDQVTLAGVALANNRDTRDLALAIAQKELQTGQQLTQQERDRLALAQQLNDASHLKDYIDQLKDEAAVAGLTTDEREKQEAILQAMRITHGQLSDAERNSISGIIEARQETERWQQGISGIANGFQDFFQTAFDTGVAKFGSLWDAIKHQFTSALAYMASQALINPIIIPMVEAMGGFAGAAAPGTAGGALGAVGSLGSLGSLGSMLGLDGLGSSISAGIGSLGGALGFSQSVSLGTNLIGAPMSASIPGSLFGATSLGSFLGGAGIGSLASSLIFGNKNDAGIGGMGGSAAGALIGSLFGGPLIGGVLGGLLGGGLGSITGSSNQGAIANFSNGGLDSYLFKQGGGNNGQLASQATGSISDALTTLKAAGVDVSLGNITGLSIGSDKSYVYDSAGGKQKLDGGDVDGVVNAVLQRILPSASATNSAAQTILDQYNAHGGVNSANLSQFEQDLQAAQQFTDAINNLQVGPSTLSAGAAALKQINDQIDPLVKQAQSLGISTANLEAVRTGAIQALVQSTEDAGTSRLRQLTDPVGAQLDALIQAEQAALQSARDIGADVSDLTAGNAAEIQQFFSGLSLDQLKALQAAGDITSASQDAFNAALNAAQAYSDLSQGYGALSGSVSDLIDQANTAANTANSAAQAWSAANDNIKQAQQSMLVSAPGLSPEQAYQNSADIFASLRSQALAGDAGAANQLASFENTFLQASNAFNATGAAYQTDYSYVQQTLQDVAALGASQQSVSERQAQSAEAAIPLLQQIATATQAGNAQTASALADLNSQFAKLKDQLALLAQQQRQAA